MGNCSCVQGEKKEDERMLKEQGDPVEKTYHLRGYLSSAPDTSDNARETILDSFLPEPHQVALLQQAVRSYLSKKQIGERMKDWLEFQSDAQIEPETAEDVAEGNFIGLLTREAGETYRKLQPFRVEQRVKGVVVHGPKRLADGSIYVGEWSILPSGLCRKGRGKLYGKDGGYSEGYWLDSKLHFLGRIIHPNGDYYEGGFLHGFRSGRGIFESLSSSTSYSGSWDLNDKHGYGEEHLPGNILYEGEFQHGAKTGKGTLKWPDGSRYTGDLVKGEIEGEGEYSWPDGRYYKGQWKAGKMHGEGEFTYSPSRLYRGHYDNDHKKGYGVYSWDGKVYEGQWLNNKMHGEGYLTIEGIRKKCEFAEGRKVRDLE